MTFDLRLGSRETFLLDAIPKSLNRLTLLRLARVPVRGMVQLPFLGSVRKPGAGANSTRARGHACAERSVSSMEH